VTKDVAERRSWTFYEGVNYDYVFADVGGILMAGKPTYEELEQRVQELEREILGCKQQEKTLVNQKMAILDASIDKIRLVDKNMRIIWANETHYRESNANPEDMSGQFCYKVFHDKKIQCSECSSRKALKDGTIKHTFLIRYPQGGIAGKRYLDSYAVPVKNERGEIVNIIQITRDVTDCHVAKEALRDREMELKRKTASFEEMNVALRVLLRKRDEYKEELEEQVLSNVKERVLPFLEKLKRTHFFDAGQSSCLCVLESNLNDIISPFSRRLSSRYLGLTPTEIQIANLIKEGKTTKWMAELMNLSDRTIEFHRDNIRKKLGIKNKKVNLSTHLLHIQ